MNENAVSVCPRCGEPILPNQKFCTSCGESVLPKQKFCPGCGEPVQPDQKFCMNCGAPLRDLTAKPLPSQPQNIGLSAATMFSPIPGLFMDGEQARKAFPDLNPAPAQDEPARNSGMPRPGEGNELLVDCYFGTTPANEAVGMSSTYELVLSRYPDGRLQLDEYCRASSRSPENRLTWFVPSDAEAAAYAVIDQYGLDRFEGRRGIAAMMMGGSPKTCKFRRGDRLIRITQDNLDPKDLTVFDAVRGVLSRYLVPGEDVTADGASDR